MRICVYGASSMTLDKVYLDDAFLMGKTLAERGIGMVYGAGATGVMGAAARGAASAGGEIVGVSPEFFQADGVLFSGCTQTIFTSTMRERKQKMEDMSDAFFVLPGGPGTFDEFFEIFTLKQLGRHFKPIVILNTNGYYNSLLAFLQYAIREKFSKPATMELFSVARTVDEAFAQMTIQQKEHYEGLRAYKAVRSDLPEGQ